MIPQRIVVAAMNAWNGKRVEWARIVHQKTVEEVQRYRTGEPKTREVYSGFYISIYCQELPPRVVAVGSPSSSVPTPSPLSSPEKAMGEMVGLRRQLENYKELLQEKRAQLVEKTEAVIKSQSANVKHIYELAQAMREKMDDRVTIENQSKAMDLLSNQLAEKTKEVETLRQQSQKQSQAAELVDKYRTEAEQVKRENESFGRN